MDKQTIVDYIEESPQNTNKAILNQMLDEYAESSSPNGGGGVQANWSQNDHTAPDYIIDRTHYPYKGKGEIIYSKERGEPGQGQYPYICDEVWENMDSSPGSWMGDLVFYLNNYRLTSESDWQDIEDENGNRKYRWESEKGDTWAQVIVEYVHVEYNRLTWTFGSDEDFWTFCKEETFYSPLSEKYIPDTIARVSDIPVVPEINYPVKSVNGKTGDVILDWATFGETVEEDQLVFFKDNFLLYGSSDGIENTSLSIGDECIIHIGGDNLLVEFNNNSEYKVIIDSNYSFNILGRTVNFVEDEPITVNLSVFYDNTTNKYTFSSNVPLSEGSFSITKLGKIQITEIDEKYIPDAIARAPKATLDDVTEAPTAEQYNALLAILRQAGILAT